MIRQPAVAGRFYPSDSRELERQVENFVAAGGARKRACGCVVPHAGYMYSGHVAGAVYAALELPSHFILLGPRHYPRGEPLAILSDGGWLTPLGEARIDSGLAAELKEACPLLREDDIAHSREHSLEVQLPFLQRKAVNASFVPIVLGTNHFSEFETLGKAIAGAVSARPEAVLIVASSDMNHYESDSITRVKDRKAIDAILALDPRGLYDTVHREEISMCGYGPAVVMLTAAVELGAKRAVLVRYATSGDVTGDREEVVGYAGMIIY